VREVFAGACTLKRWHYHAKCRHQGCAGRLTAGILRMSESQGFQNSSNILLQTLSVSSHTHTHARAHVQHAHAQGPTDKAVVLRECLGHEGRDAIEARRTRDAMRELESNEGAERCDMILYGRVEM
jgi:hypothetical protein